MRLLVIRTSAMGDVALTTPVLRAVLNQHPGMELVILTRPSFKPFFYSIKGLTFFPADLKGRHKGFIGLLSLFAELRNSGRFDVVIDLHDVLRSKILRSLFRLTGVHSYVIDKGRKEKRKVISGKSSGSLRHTVDRYMDVFGRAGYHSVAEARPSILPVPEAVLKMTSVLDKNGGIKLGVAPYAKHKLKMWPEKYMIHLLGMISEKYNVSIFLFGGKEDSDRLGELQSLLPGSVNTAGGFTLEEELALMSGLDVMIAMDSSNMHMAALCGTKVISIWGGTDPRTGFGAWMQPNDHFISISVDELPCRPCTVFGKGECKRGDLACMNWLTPEIVFRKIEKILQQLAGKQKD